MDGSIESDSFDKKYLNHFCAKTYHDLSWSCCRFSDEADYNQQIQSSAAECESLKYGICGLAAQQMSMTDHDQALIAVYYMVKALNALRREMHNSPSDLSSVGTVVMLANIEAFDGNFKNWRSHLQGGSKSIILSTVHSSSSLDSYLALVKDRAISHIIENLAYHDILSSLAINEQPLLSDLYRYGWTFGLNDSGKNSYLTLIGPLLINLAEICCLVAELSPQDNSYSYKKSSSLNSDDEISHDLDLVYDIKNATDVGKNIVHEYGSNENLPQPFNHVSLSTDRRTLSPLQSIRKKAIEQTLLKWKLPKGCDLDMQQAANLLVICQELYLMVQFDAGRSGQSFANKLREKFQAGFDILKSVPTNSHLTACHGWVIAQLGLFCHDLDDKNWIIERLQTCSSLYCKKSFLSVLAFLRAFWELQSRTENKHLTYRQILVLTNEKVGPPIYF